MLEVLIASVTLAMVAGGSMSAFITAVRISRDGGVSSENAFLAQQTMERYRNKIACRQTAESGTDTWYGPGAGCAAAPPVGAQTDAISGADFTVTPIDCDGVAGPGDCLEMQVTKTDP
jgi:Tfp pilus assembly protein PilV